jgi:hypothetical protein
LHIFYYPVAVVCPYAEQLFYNLLRKNRILALVKKVPLSS